MNSFSLIALRQTRQNILRAIAPFGLDDLNRIPGGYPNNLIWNLGHAIVTQQLLCYSRNRLKPHLPEEIIEKYRKGSRPEDRVLEREYQQLKQWAEEMVDRLEEDLQQEKFKGYQEYETSYGLKLHNIQEAMEFNNIHEAMHLGNIKALGNTLGQ